MPSLRRRNARWLAGGAAAIALSFAVLCAVVGFAPGTQPVGSEMGETASFVVNDKVAGQSDAATQSGVVAQSEAAASGESLVGQPVDRGAVQQIDASQQSSAQADRDQATSQSNDAAGFEPAVIVDEATGNAYAANRIVVTVSKSTDAEELEAMLADQGIVATEIDLIFTADDVLIYAVSYSGSQDPASLDGALNSVDESFIVEPDYIMTLEGTPYEGPEENSHPAGSSQAVAIEDEGASFVLAEGGSADGAFSDGASSGAAFSDAASSDLAASDIDAPALDATANDTYFSRQWENTAVKGTTAWDVVKANGNVTVVVIDSGADANHPDLKNNLILGNYAKNTYTETYGASAINDIVGHGTHVAGIIAAQANNSQGTAGITYNAKVLPIKVSFNERGQMYTSDIVEAMDYVVGLKTNSSSPDYLKNIRVINMSLGGGSYLSSFQTAINKATQSGILVVATAGNNTGYVSEYYPGGYNNVLCVSALEQSSSSPGFVFDSSYSNWGPMVDISGPGTSLYAPVPTSSYGYKSGTSMAAPVVSGVAALNFAINMRYTPAEVMSLLQTTAVDVTKTDTGASTGTGFDQRTGSGCVQAYASVNKAKSSLVNIANATASSVPD